MQTPRRGQGVTLLLVSTLTVMSGAIIAPSLPGIRAAFADLPQVDLLTRLVLTSPALAIALGAPFAGWLIDRLDGRPDGRPSGSGADPAAGPQLRHGRHRVLFPAMALYVLAGTAGLYISTMTGLIASRVLLGFAIAGILPAATTLIADLYTGEARGRFMGIQGAFMALGGTVFLVAGGALADQSWRAPFTVYGAAVLLFPAVVLFIPRPAVESATHDGHASDTTASYGLTVAVLYSVLLLGMALFYIVPVQLPFLMGSRLGATGVHVGMALALSTTCAAVSSLNTARVVARIRRRGVLILAFSLPTIGLAGLATADTWFTVLGFLAIAGFGFGFIMPNTMAWLADVAPPAKRGQIMAGATTAVFIGQFLSPIASSPFVGAGSRVGPAFTAGAVANGVLSLICVASFVTHRRRTRPA